MRALEEKFHGQNNLFIGNNNAPVSIDLIHQNLDGIIEPYLMNKAREQLSKKKEVMLSQQAYLEDSVRITKGILDILKMVFRVQDIDKSLQVCELQNRLLSLEQKALDMGQMIASDDALKTITRINHFFAIGKELLSFDSLSEAFQKMFDVIKIATEENIGKLDAINGALQEYDITLSRPNFDTTTKLPTPHLEPAPPLEPAHITQLKHENDRPYDVIMWFNNDLEVKYKGALSSFSDKKVYIVGNGIQKLGVEDLRLSEEIASKITSETQLIFSSHGSDELPNDCYYNFAEGITLTSKEMVAKLLSPISDAQKSRQTSLNYGVSLHISSCHAGKAIHNDDIRFIPDISDILPLSTCFMHAGEESVTIGRGMKVFDAIKDHDFSDGVNSRFKLMQTLYLNDTPGDGVFIQLPPQNSELKEEALVLKMTAPAILDTDNILQQWNEYAGILATFAVKHSIEIEDLKGITIDITQYLDSLIEFSAIQECSVTQKLLEQFQLLKAKGLLSEDDYSKYINKFIARIDTGSSWTSELLKLFEEFQGEGFVANKVLNASSIINIAHELHDTMSIAEKHQSFMAAIEKYKLQEITLKDLAHWNKPYICNFDILMWHCGIKKGSVFDVIEYLSDAKYITYPALQLHLPTYWCNIGLDTKQSIYSNTTASMYEKYKHFMQHTNSEMKVSIQDLKITQEKFSPNELGEILQTMQTTFSITEVMEIFGNINLDRFETLLAKAIPHIDWSQLDLDTVIKALQSSDKYLAVQNWTYLLKHFPEKFVSITDDKTFSINEVTEMVGNLWDPEALINILELKIERNNIDIDHIIRNVNAQSAHLKENTLKNCLYLLDKFTDGGIAHTLRILSECAVDNQLPYGTMELLIKSSINIAELEKIMSSYDYSNEMFQIINNLTPDKLNIIIDLIVRNHEPHYNLCSILLYNSKDPDTFVAKLQILLAHSNIPDLYDITNYMRNNADILTRIIDSMIHANIKEIAASRGVLDILECTQENITQICLMLKTFEDNNIVLKMDSKAQVEDMINKKFAYHTNADPLYVKRPDMSLEEIKAALFQYLTFPSMQEEAISVSVDTILEEVLGVSLEEAMVTAIDTTNMFDQE